MRLAERLLDCKTVRIFAYSSTREQSNKRSGARLKTESETEERRFLSTNYAKLTDFKKKSTILQSRRLLRWLTHPRYGYTIKFQISPGGLYFSKALLEGLIFGGGYNRRGLSMEGNLRSKIDWASLIVGGKFTVFALFYFAFEGNFQVQAPGGLIYGGAI